MSRISAHAVNRLVQTVALTGILLINAIVPSASAGPMAAWFGGYEKYVIDDEFAPQSGACIDTHWPPVDLSRLSQYSSILIGNRGGRTLTAEENAALEKWVAAGGTLIFTADEPRRLWDNKPPAWVGGDGAGAWWSSAGFVATIRQPDHPLLKGIAEVAPKVGWKEEAGFGFTAGESLIGADKVTILYENKHGAGRIIYAAPQFIPSAWPAFTGDAPAGLTRNMTPLMRQFWTNLIAYVGVPTRQEMMAQWA
jgi:hypothetical protein